MSTISLEKKRWLTGEIAKLAGTGMSKAEIARRLEIAPQALNNILNRDKSVSDAFIDRFIQAFGLNQIDFSRLLQNDLQPEDTSEVEQLKAEIEQLRQQNQDLLTIIKNLSAK